MLDLFATAELVREKTRQSLDIEVTNKPTGQRDLHRRGALRLRSATALRGLADRIEPSRTDPVAG